MSNLLRVLANHFGFCCLNNMFRAIGFPMISKSDFNRGTTCYEDKKTLMQAAIYLGDLGINILLKLRSLKLAQPGIGKD